MCRYEARVSALNEEGWSTPSHIFYFATKGAGRKNCKEEKGAGRKNYKIKTQTQKEKVEKNYKIKTQTQKEQVEDNVKQWKHKHKRSRTRKNTNSEVLLIK